MAIITDIVKTNKDKGQLYELFVDEESIGLYHIETIVKHSLQKGNEVDKDEVENVLIESATLIAIEKVLNLISTSMKTKKEIVDYLKKKNYNQKVIDNVIAKLNEYNYINDEVYAKYYACCHCTKEGKRKLKFDLIKKGVSEEIVSKVLLDFDENLDDIRRIAEKYLKGKARDYKTKSKLFSHLVSKGYDYDNINKVIGEFNWGESNEDWV